MQDGRLARRGASSSVSFQSSLCLGNRLSHTLATRALGPRLSPAVFSSLSEGLFFFFQDQEFEAHLGWESGAGELQSPGTQPYPFSSLLSLARPRSASGSWCRFGKCSAGEAKLLAWFLKALDIFVLCEGFSHG